jgi:putative transposase
VIVVDSETRAPIQRPWLTLAIDVCTRCVAGFHLSLEPPSATSVALCLAHAALGKESWLAERGIDAVWPVRGVPERLHLDNAKEFRSEALKQGCEQYGIAIDHRPVRTPHYGGHIERLIGTMMGKVHLLRNDLLEYPGERRSQSREKCSDDAGRGGALARSRDRRRLSSRSASRDRHDAGCGLGTRYRWRRSHAWPGRTNAGCRSAPLPDRLPPNRTAPGAPGRRIAASIHYWADMLAAWVGHPERMIVRYDPRDLSRIHLLGPDGAYYDLSYRDLRRPPISLWEHRLALKRLREDGRAQVDEAAIFRTIEIMRGIADEAVRASKTARRQRERRLRVIQGGSNAPVVSAAQSSIEAESLDGRQPHENMLPFEEWG